MTLGIGDGLRRFLKAHKKPLVGVMGGHGVTRDSDAYVDIARLTVIWPEKYLIVTGGGPGVMEAAHVGVAFSTSPEATFQAALKKTGRQAGLSGARQFARRGRLDFGGMDDRPGSGQGLAAGGDRG